MELNQDLQPETRDDSVGGGDDDAMKSDELEASEVIQETVVQDVPEDGMRESTADEATKVVVEEVPMAVEKEASSNTGYDVKPKPRKKSNAMALGMMCMVIAALAGIAFGVWAMMDAEKQKSELNSQISNLKQENKDLQNENAQLNKKIDDLEDSSQYVTPVGPTGSSSVFGGEYVDGVFYIKDSSGEVLAEDNSVEVVEVIGCSSPVGEPGVDENVLVCGVETLDGSGSYVYNGNDGTLVYHAD